MTALLGVEPGERRSVALMLAHSFFMGTAAVYFETAASASFLSRFSGSMLPWVYIAAAVVNLGTGAAYARVQKRASFSTLMKGTLWFLLGLVVAVRAGFAVSSAAWIAFAGLVVYRILSILTDLEYWAVASRIYDVGQAKRLFGLVGTGEPAARILGAFSVPFLVHRTGVPNLILFSGAGLALCLVVLRPILHAAERHADAAPPESIRSARAGFRAITGSHYLRLVVGVAVLATFGKYFVDFAFLGRVSALSSDEKQIATVLALFNGVTQSLSLLTRVFLSRPFLSRFGIRGGVLVLPVLHALCAAITVIAGIVGAPAWVTWSVIGNQGVYKTFKHPIDNASFKVLYQPLRREQRLATQIAVEVMFSPVTVGLAGVVMLVFSHGVSPDPAVFAGLLFVLFVSWAWAAGAAGRAYAQRLVDTLQPGAERPSTRSLADVESVGRALLAELLVADSAERNRVLIALDALGFEQRGSAPIAALLRAEADEAVRILASLRDASLESERGLQRAQLEQSWRESRARMIQLLALCRDRDKVERAAAHLHHASKEQRAYARELLEVLLEPSERRWLLPLLLSGV